MKVRSFTRDDIDFIITRHIDMYAIEYGFTSDVWKSYINDGVHELVNKFDPGKDCIYILEVDSEPRGCVAITHIDDVTAQLRFYLVEPALRGLGAGNKLINMAIDFCAESGYESVFLWTFSKLEAARHLYAKKGFHITQTHENTEWGKPVLEERWDLVLR